MVSQKKDATKLYQETLSLISLQDVEVIAYSRNNPVAVVDRSNTIHGAYVLLRVMETKIEKGERKFYPSYAKASGAVAEEILRMKLRVGSRVNLMGTTEYFLLGDNIIPFMGCRIRMINFSNSSKGNTASQPVTKREESKKLLSKASDEMDGQEGLIKIPLDLDSFNPFLDEKGSIISLPNASEVA